MSAERQHLEAEHEPRAIRRRLAAAQRHSYLGDAVLGAIDGCVTTFAVVSGVIGGQLHPGVAVLLGVANLLADGFSMAVGNYQRAKAEHDEVKKARRTEERHIREIPEGEREEIRQIFAGKGFEEPVLGQIVDTITADPKLWIETMLTEEHGLRLQAPSPARAGWTTFLAFVLIGAIPLIPFMVMQEAAPLTTFWTSCAVTGAAFFGVGVAKGRVLGEPPLKDGLETLAMGAAAAAVAYGIGALLRGLVPAA